MFFGHLCSRLARGYVKCHDHNDDDDDDDDDDKDDYDDNKKRVLKHTAYNCIYQCII